MLDANQLALEQAYHLITPNYRGFETFLSIAKSVNTPEGSGTWLHFPRPCYRYPCSDSLLVFVDFGLAPLVLELLYCAGAAVVVS